MRIAGPAACPVPSPCMHGDASRIPRACTVHSICCALPAWCRRPACTALPPDSIAPCTVRALPIGLSRSPMPSSSSRRTSLRPTSVRSCSNNGGPLHARCVTAHAPCMRGACEPHARCRRRAPLCKRTACTGNALRLHAAGAVPHSAACRHGASLRSQAALPVQRRACMASLQGQRYVCTLHAPRPLVHAIRVHGAFPVPPRCRRAAVACMQSACTLHVPRLHIAGAALRSSVRPAEPSLGPHAWRLQAACTVVLPRE